MSAASAVLRVEAPPGSPAFFQFNLAPYAGQRVTILIVDGASGSGVSTDLIVVSESGAVVRGTVVTGIDADLNLLPSDFTIRGNYPNPFSGSTRLLLDLPESSEVTFELYDILGRRVLHGQGGIVSAGPSQELTVDGSRLASGTYMVAVTARGARKTYRATRTMLVVH